MLQVPSRARALLVVFHGHGDRPIDLVDALTDSAAVDLSGFALLAPIGPTATIDRRPAWFPSAEGDDGPSLSHALDGLDALVHDVRAEHAIGTLPTAYLGYSQGGAAALAAAFRAEAGVRPRHVIGLAAWLPSEPDIAWALAPAQDVAVTLVHGSDDEVVPAPLARGAARALARDGVAARCQEIDAGHALEPLLTADIDGALQMLIGR